MVRVSSVVSGGRAAAIALIPVRPLISISIPIVVSIAFGALRVGVVGRPAMRCDAAALGLDAIAPLVATRFITHLALAPVLAHRDLARFVARLMRRCVVHLTT